MKIQHCLMDEGLVSTHPSIWAFSSDLKRIQTPHRFSGGVLISEPEQIILGGTSPGNAYQQPSPAQNFPAQPLFQGTTWALAFQFTTP